MPRRHSRRVPRPIPRVQLVTTTSAPVVVIPDRGDAYTRTDWLPSLDQLHLRFAVLGLTSIADPTHLPPEPIDFEPPNVSRLAGMRLPLVAR